MAENKDYELEVQANDEFDLDSLETMPGFIVPPTGMYLVNLTKGIEEKDINDADYYSVEMTIGEVLEFSEKQLDVGEEPPKAGDICSTIFGRGNKFGMSNFKKFVTPIAEKFGTKKIGQIRELSKGLDMVIVVKRNWNKKQERHNLEIVRSAVT